MRSPASDASFAPDIYIDMATGGPLPDAPVGMLLSAQAAAAPDAPALTIDATCLTFAELDRRANRRARQLAEAGVLRGDRVIIALGNRPEYFDCAFALWKLGATPCPISNRLKPQEFDAIVDLAEPRLVLAEQDVEGHASLLIDGPPPERFADAPLPPAISRPGKVVSSGGSTGRPKLIVDPIPSVWGPDKEVIGRNPRSVMLNASPLYHSGPFAICAMALAQGSHVVCMPKFEAEEWLKLVEEHQVAFAYVVPTIMTRIAKADADVSGRADLSSLRALVHTAAPCPPAIKRWWIDRIGGRHVLEIYGGSERIGATVIDGEEWLGRPGSVGRPLRGGVEILGEDGEVLPPGEIGEIFFRRPADQPSGYSYVGSEGRDREGLDGFGDMGWVDEDGYLFIADRRTDMVVVGGANIYPAEIEAAIDSLPGVLGSAVIGLPDPDLGNRIHAIVEIAEGEKPDPDALLSRLRQHLTGFKVPRTVEFTYERIRDDAGKVRRSALRQERLGKA